MDNGLEALAGSHGTSPAKAPSPSLFIHYSLFIIHYPFYNTPVN
jgi:hypothetical protein